MKVRGAIAGLVSVIVVLLSGSTCISSSKPIQTTLEKSNYTQLTSSEEILQFLDTLSQRNPGNTEMSILGASAKGKPLGALLISQKPGHFNQKLSSPSRLTVMLVGSQHGSEPSGAEALLLLSRDILEGALRHYLSVADFIVIPDSNPDGRTANRRVNGNGVNLSTNYDLLTEPECRALVDALYRWQPEVILDIHESAVLKKQSLGREGFLTDVEAQFEAANNPNVDSGIRTFTYERFLPELVAAVSAKGLPCQRYIGEITSVNQVITHAGLSLRNLRNRAGMAGCFSFLLENKLDPSTSTYSTPRNIKERVRKQSLCLREFIACIAAHEKKVLFQTAAARSGKIPGGEQEPLFLSFFYQSDPRQPTITLPLRRRDTGERIFHTFPYRGLISSASPLRLPKAYIIRSHHELMRAFLTHQHVEYSVAAESVTVPVIIHNLEHYKGLGDEKRFAQIPPPALPEQADRYSMQPGDIVVPIDQPNQKLAVLLLEPRSMSSVFLAPPFSRLIETKGDLFICRVPYE